RREGRTIVFVDESGLSQRPHRCRTWAPRGQTPILEFNFNWKSLSAVAGLTLLSFYFRLYAGAVKGPQVIDFLQALVQHIRKPLLLVWDRLPAHRSRLVRDYIDQLDGRIQVEYLPAYAPELNQALTMSPQCTDGAYFIRRAKTALQKANGMKVLNPLAVRNVALPPRHTLQIMSVYKEHFEPSRLQNLKDWNPVDTSRFHRYR